MSQKVATNNIFASLQDDSDNEAPVKTTSTKVVSEAKPAQTVAKGTNNNNNNRGYRGERKEGDNTEEKVNKDNHQRPKYVRDGQKPKGVPAEPHPQDRKSGTGISGVDKKKFRKDGGGRGNYGTIKGEVQQIKNDEAKETKQEAVVVEEEVEVEPEVIDNTITAEEYFKKLGYEDVKPVVKVEKKLNLDELKREKLQVVVSKNEKVLDSDVVKANQKKNKGPTTYSVGCNTENSQLLGVKTGHTLVKYTVGKEGDELVGKIAEKRDDKEREPRESRQPRENKPDNKDKKPFVNKNKKVNIENESDFPKLA